MGSLKLSFGDPVTGPPEAPGVWIVTEMRRADCRILSPRTGRSLWVSLGGLRRVAADRIRGTLEERIVRLVRTLSGVALEVAVLGDHRFRLIITHGAILPDAVDTIREQLGADRRNYIIRPQGMRRIESILEFVHDEDTPPPE